MNRQCATEFVDGKLALLTNTPDLTPTETVKHYEALADIECGFRVLNSDIEIAPVHRRLPDRICSASQLMGTATPLSDTEARGNKPFS